MDCKIIPAILTPESEVVKEQLNKFANLFPYVQIDVMDGKLVPKKTFTDVEVLETFPSKLQYELHLMVQDPLLEMEKWIKVKNVFRVIFHVEATGDLQAAIRFARGACWQVGIALNPETPIKQLDPYLSSVTLVQFMTVHPGQQGAEFLPEVLKKIKTFANKKTNVLISIDGGINAKTIKKCKGAPIDIFNVGSVFKLTTYVNKAYEELKAALGI
jgi:ribulose-phosphate 3-epimerase